MVSATKLKKRNFPIKITKFANINPQNDLKKKDLYGLKYHLTSVQC